MSFEWFSCCIPGPRSRHRGAYPSSSEEGQDTATSDTEEGSPQPVYIRFENRTSASVTIFWRDCKGEEKRYFDLNPNCSISQSTYKDNEWVVRNRNTEAIVLRTRVSEHKRQACIVGPEPVVVGRHHMISTKSDFHIPECYTQKMWSSMGIAIVGTSSVNPAALGIAAHVVDRMLQLTPSGILKELREHRCKVALIPRDAVTTDILEHSHLKGSTCPDGRDWDTETRGLGGTRVNPTCSVGEENVLRCHKDRYHRESILVHEFAHTVMEVGFSKPLMTRIRAVYQASKSRYTEGCYMIADPSEYWAEGTESWFDATMRDDVNCGVKTREQLREHDPEFAELLEEIYGDGPWRFEGNWRPQGGAGRDCKCRLCVVSDCRSAGGSMVGSSLWGGQDKASSRSLESKMA